MSEASRVPSLLSGTSTLVEGMGIEDAFLLLVAGVGFLTFCWGLILGLICDPDNSAIYEFLLCRS